ncbi:MAG: hypothetical protein HQ515_21765 [Phycisphaeraceae bacterium]|nr:hypothetical protein [Phycisphaeraceae bacterium]
MGSRKSRTRTIILMSLILGLIPLAGCQSSKVAYKVETQITPFPDTNQHLVKIKVIQVSPGGNRVVASPSCFVWQGQEASMNLENPSGTAIDCNVLVELDTSSTSVSLSKKGKVFWSSEHTTAVNNKGQTHMTSLGKRSRSKHDEDVIEALEKRFKDQDGGGHIQSDPAGSVQGQI